MEEGCFWVHQQCPPEGRRERDTGVRVRVRALGIGLGLEIMDNVFGEEKIICAKVRC